MPSEAYILAIFEPTDEKHDEFQSEVNTMIKHVWDQEKNTCSQYEWCQDTSNPKRYFFIETYASEKDAKEHGQTPYFNKFAEGMKTKNWLATDPIIVVGKPVGGFHDRQQGLL